MSAHDLLQTVSFERLLPCCFARPSSSNALKVAQQAKQMRVEPLSQTKDSYCYAMMEQAVERAYGNDEDKVSAMLQQLPNLWQPREPRLPVLKGEMWLLVNEFSRFAEAVYGLSYYLAELDDVDITVPQHLQPQMYISGTVQDLPVVIEYGVTRHGSRLLHVLYVPELRGQLEGLGSFAERGSFLADLEAQQAHRVQQPMYIVSIWMGELELANFLVLFTESNAMTVTGIEFCYRQKLIMPGRGRYPTVREGKVLEAPASCLNVLPRFATYVDKMITGEYDQQLSLQYQAFSRLPILVQMVLRMHFPVFPEKAGAQSVNRSEQQALLLQRQMDNISKMSSRPAFSSFVDAIAYLQFQRMLADPSFEREWNQWNYQTEGALNEQLATADQTGAFAQLLDALQRQVFSARNLKLPTMVSYLRPL